MHVWPFSSSINTARDVCGTRSSRGEIVGAGKGQGAGVCGAPQGLWSFSHDSSPLADFLSGVHCSKEMNKPARLKRLFACFDENDASRGPKASAFGADNPECLCAAHQLIRSLSRSFADLCVYPPTFLPLPLCPPAVTGRADITVKQCLSDPTRPPALPDSHRRHISVGRRRITARCVRRDNICEEGLFISYLLRAAFTRTVL